MASSITSAGVASGMDFESIITAMVDAKKATYEKNTTIPKQLTQLEISGVASLKSSLETFQKALSALTEESSFNARKVTSSGSDYFSITTDDEASNMDLDITVLSLATTEKLAKKIDSASNPNVANGFQAGTIKINLGVDPDAEEGTDAATTERIIEINIEEGDTLDEIRSKINQNDYGLTANLIKGEDGYQLSFDTGKTGSTASAIKIETETASDAATANPEGATYATLDIFNFDSNNGTDNSNNGFTRTAGTDAKIEANGVTLTSTSNTFEDKISGVSITVKKVSETLTEEEVAKLDSSKYVTVEQADGTKKYYKTYENTISQDTDGVAKKVEEFVNAYNTLTTALDTLSARNTYTDGENNYDGGALAGDTTVTSLKSQLSSMISSFSVTSNGASLFDMGIEFEDDGTLSFESADFKEALEDNYNGVIKIFADKEVGIINKLDTFIEDYTKSQGTLDLWTEQLNQELADIEDKELRNAEYLEAYEASLRERYSALDIMMANNNSALSSLSSVLTSLNASNKS